MEIVVWNDASKKDGGGLYCRSIALKHNMNIDCCRPIWIIDFDTSL